MNTDTGIKGTKNSRPTPTDRGIVFKKSEKDDKGKTIRGGSPPSGSNVWPYKHSPAPVIDNNKRREIVIRFQTTPTIRPQKIKTGSLRETAARIVTQESERRKAIIERSPAVFEVAENPGQKRVWHLGGLIGTFETVSKYANIIEAAAKRQNLDPDFVKAVVYLESSHSTGVEPIIQEDLGLLLGDSPRPMNVRASLWGKDLGVSKEELANPAIIIEVGTFILGEIWKRTRNPTPEKVGTLYQDLRATRVSAVGKSVEYYYWTKPWETSEN